MILEIKLVYIFWEVVKGKEDDIESIAKIIGEIIYQGLYR